MARPHPVQVRVKNGRNGHGWLSFEAGGGWLWGGARGFGLISGSRREGSVGGILATMRMGGASAPQQGQLPGGLPRAAVSFSSQVSGLGGLKSSVFCSACNFILRFLVERIP